MIIKYEDNSKDVMLLQKRLGVTITGTFAAETARAVVSFQTKNGLYPDGIVGPKTITKLFPSGFPVFPNNADLIIPNSSVNLNPLSLNINVDILKETIATYKRLNVTPTNLNVAHLLGQIALESKEFTKFRENMNYSAKRLRAIFPNIIKTDAQAKSLSRQPIKIANTVYANRLGNGNYASGDGWRFRGAGGIMVTGRWNMDEMADDLNERIIFDNPDILATKYRILAGGWFFSQNNIWAMCKSVSPTTIGLITNKINTAMLEVEKRGLYTNTFYTQLCVGDM